MGCSIISDKMSVTVKGNEAHKKAGGKLCGSALQNPDMSRFQLNALLRTKDGVSPRAGKTFWNTVVMQQKASSANSNDVASS